MSRHAFLYLDTETTGLEDTDQVWQLAWILEHANGEEIARRDTLIGHSRNPHPWVLANTLYVAKFTAAKACTSTLTAEMFSISEISRAAGYTDPKSVYLVGAVPSFDDFKIRRITYTRWNYTLICIETLVMGAFALEVPPKLEELAQLTGVTNPQPHDAMADAQHVRDLMHWLRKKNAS